MRSSLAASSASRSTTAIALVADTLDVTSTSSTAVEYSDDLFPSTRMSPFAMCHSVPCPSRRSVTRIETRSTTPS